MFAIFLAAPVYAMSNAQSSAIQAFVDEARYKSGVPGIAVSVRVGNEVRYFTSGYANTETLQPVTEETLFELASVSKAFTAYGILLLEEQGLLSMDDPIQKYLPWFTLKYEGKPVDMDKVTLNNFLHHTSGLTNGKHDMLIPVGEGPDMLRKTVDAFVGAELTFAPGERFEYGTMNYDVLALVAAVVSGQCWEDFMQTQVLNPLGLNNTYMYNNAAAATSRLARGYGLVFTRVIPYDNQPVMEGNKPAGYIITCAKDMARWSGIQMGLVRDVPENCQAIVAKSHQGDTSIPEVNGLRYAAGWYVNFDGTYLTHSGQNLAASTNVVLYPEEQTAVCLLTNASHINNMMTENIHFILLGDLTQSYDIGFLQIFDRIGTWITIAGVIVTVLFLLLGLRRWRIYRTKTEARHNFVLTIVWSVATVAILALGIMFPTLIGTNWHTAIMARYYSVAAALAALALASGSVTWFVFARVILPLPSSPRFAG